MGELKRLGVGTDILPREEIALTALRFDLDRTKGQVRRLAPAWVHEIKEGLTLSEMEDVNPVTVVQADVLGVPARTCAQGGMGTCSQVRADMHLVAHPCSRGSVPLLPRSWPCRLP